MVAKSVENTYSFGRRDEKAILHKFSQMFLVRNQITHAIVKFMLKFG